MTATFERLGPDVARTWAGANVYLVRTRDGAVAIDAGDGSWVEDLPSLRFGPLVAVLATHHHRDGTSGLPRLAATGVPVFVPETELGFFTDAPGFWLRREHLNSYNNRQDRFTPVEDVPGVRPLRDYDRVTIGGQTFLAQPTPGHTTGSVSLVTDLAGERVAFTGDLISAGGTLPDLAATQWSYNGGEGLAGTVLSCLDLLDAGVATAYPQHGAVVTGFPEAARVLIERLRELMALRRHNPRLLDLHAHPYDEVVPRVLFNRTSMANAYVITCGGEGLAIDFGYDFMFGQPAGTDRASRRPWLHTLPALKAQHGVTVTAAIPTHYHDDHVAGLNLLRRVYGTRILLPASFAGILERPEAHRLPCLWYDPIPADETLPLNEWLAWRDVRYRLHPMPGHTRYAVGIEVELDDRRLIFVGDQYADGDALGLNYVYENVFDPRDYVRTAELLRRVRPSLLLTGHWAPVVVTDGMLDTLEERGRELERLHATLQPQGPAQRLVLTPYHRFSRPGE
ncbi:MAG TPA: MBL fold metallo-hydrolase, partial [Deinococcales bacterium]|nr:MBL fold metallo-hydrolase [Deinococcales bacterium]